MCHVFSQNVVKNRLISPPEIYCFDNHRQQFLVFLFPLSLQVVWLYPWGCSLFRLLLISLFSNTIPCCPNLPASQGHASVHTHTLTLHLHMHIHNAEESKVELIILPHAVSMHTDVHIQVPTPEYNSGSQIWQPEADWGGRTGVIKTVFTRSKTGLESATNSGG